MMLTNRTVKNWSDAENAVRAIAAEHGSLPVLYGTGNPVYTAHVQASTLDAWSGEGVGFFVTVKPEGDGYGTSCHSCYVYVNPS